MALFRLIWPAPEALGIQSEKAPSIDIFGLQHLHTVFFIRDSLKMSLECLLNFSKICLGIGRRPDEFGGLSLNCRNLLFLAFLLV